jgi:uncharacterized lipoprotein YehR (DUF1307 family)
VKKILSALVALLMVFATASALAADLSGDWTGSVNNGQFQITFTFKQDGATLTGTVQAAQGDPIPITDGKIDGDKLSFTVNFNGTTIHHTGTLSGDTIKLTTEGGDFGAMEMTLKRAPAASSPGTASPATASPAAPAPPIL